MYKIFLIEFKKTFKSPITIGYLFFPTIIFFVFLLSFDIPYSLSFTIMVQTLFISLFFYGSKIIDYNYASIKKKIKNSHIKNINVTTSILFLSLIILFLSFLIPLIYSLINVDSLSKFVDKQYSYFNNDLDSGGLIMADELEKGLNKNLLLFNSNWSQFFQFVFALFFAIGSCFSISHFIAKRIKNSSTYFSFVFLIFILIIIFSSFITKQVFVLKDNEYTRNITLVQNKFFLLIKYINPFFWINQLLMNTIIADVNSGEYVEGLFPPDSAINATGTFVPSYYNIFDIGTSIGNSNFDSSEFESYNRIVYLYRIEIIQLFILVFPIFSFLTPLIINSILGGVS